MARFSTQPDAGAERLKTGIYRTRLISVKRASYRASETGLDEPKYLWTFATIDHMRSDGEPYLVFHRTGVIYDANRPRMGLTRWINSLYQRPFTRDEYNGFDPSRLGGLRFRLRVRLDQTPRGAWNVVVGAEPLDALPSPIEAGE